MNDTTAAEILNDDDVFVYDIADEALELAATTPKLVPGSQTLAFCSGLDTCPA